MIRCDKNHSISEGDAMGSLNPEWLAIELDSIDDTVKNWNEAIAASYKAAVEALQEKSSERRPQAAGLDIQ